MSKKDIEDIAKEMKKRRTNILVIGDNQIDNSDQTRVYGRLAQIW